MRKLLLTTTAIAFAVGAAAPAMAEFNSRNIRVSNGINQDHFAMADKVHPLGTYTRQKQGGFFCAGEWLTLGQQLWWEKLLKG